MEDIPRTSCRRINRIDEGLSTVDTDDLILVSDSRCDQSIITSHWTVTHYTGRHIIMTGPFKGRNVGHRFPVVSAVAKIIDRKGNAYAGEIHEALLDKNDNQKESLLATHQALLNKSIGIDDRSIYERDINGNSGTWNTIS